MSVEQIIVGLIVLGVIAFISWWFFGKHEGAAQAAAKTGGKQVAVVKVHGGYSPSTVVLKKGIPGQVDFEMHDQTACLSHVVFEQLGINKDLTKQKITSIKIPTDKAQTFNFACGMGMNHGKVVVK